MEELDTIRADHTDLLDCLTAMLKTWLKLTKPIPTWRALEVVLGAPTINEVELANQGGLPLRSQGLPLSTTRVYLSPQPGSTSLLSQGLGSKVYLCQAPLFLLSHGLPLSQAPLYCFRVYLSDGQGLPLHWAPLFFLYHNFVPFFYSKYH